MEPSDISNVIESIHVHVGTYFNSICLAQDLASFLSVDLQSHEAKAGSVTAAVSDFDFGLWFLDKTRLPAVTNLNCVVLELRHVALTH